MDDRPRCNILLPLYTCVFPNVGYPMLFQSDEDVFVPFFTSLECFDLFVKSTQQRPAPLKLATVQSVREFLTNPPTPNGEKFGDFTVAIDLLDGSPSEITGFPIADLIESLQRPENN